MEISLSQVDLREVFAAGKRGEDVIYLRKRVLIHFELGVDGYLKISAEAYGAVFLDDRHDGCRPVAPSDFGDDAVTF